MASEEPLTRGLFARDRAGGPDRPLCVPRTEAAHRPFMGDDCRAEVETGRVGNPRHARPRRPVTSTRSPRALDQTRTADPPGSLNGAEKSFTVCGAGPCSYTTGWDSTERLRRTGVGYLARNGTECGVLVPPGEMHSEPLPRPCGRCGWRSQTLRRRWMSPDGRRPASRERPVAWITARR
jgi:hypothetical protein